MRRQEETSACIMASLQSLDIPSDSADLSQSPTTDRALGPGSRAKDPKMIRTWCLLLKSDGVPAPASLDWGAVKGGFMEEGAFELNV